MAPIQINMVIIQINMTTIQINMVIIQINMMNTSIIIIMKGWKVRSHEFSLALAHNLDHSDSSLVYFQNQKKKKNHH
jgi:hypothetical protein